MTSMVGRATLTELSPELHCMAAGLIDRSIEGCILFAFSFSHENTEHSRAAKKTRDFGLASELRDRIIVDQVVKDRSVAVRSLETELSHIEVPCRSVPPRWPVHADRGEQILVPRSNS
jgi:hypothetical protein